MSLRKNDTHKKNKKKQKVKNKNKKLEKEWHNLGVLLLMVVKNVSHWFLAFDSTFPSQVNKLLVEFQDITIEDLPSELPSMEQ